MNWDTYQESVSKFIQLAEQITDWKFSYIEELQKFPDNPEEWLDDVRNKIDSCEIIISFNGMSFLMVTGTYRAEFQERLIKKIRSGTPVFSKLLEYRINSNSDFDEDLMKPICKTLGASALFYRVYSNTNRPQNDPNPYCTIFEKAKDELRDPELFKKVNSVYGDAAALINYEPELYPLIDAAPSDFQFVDQGDLFFNGSLGMKNTIAVRGDLFDSIQILYTGRMFENAYDDVMGRVHFGIEKNLKFAENIIKCLDAAVSKSVIYETKCYEMFSQLERRLGLLIESKLSSADVVVWIDEHSRENEYKRTNLGQLNFIELSKIICSHWTTFDSHIALDKEPFRLKCNAINKRERRYLAHPIKAETDGYDFSENSNQLISEVLKALPPHN
jgi:hypothetical protein